MGDIKKLGLVPTSLSNNGLMGQSIRKIKLTQLVPYANHTFHVSDDDELMRSNVESIRSLGDVAQPVIARPLAADKYEIVSGHRRVRACELAGLTTVSVIVKSLTDEEADKLMSETNQHRIVKPSEKARSYKVWVDADKRQGMRSDLTSPQVEGKSQNAPDLTSPQVEGKSQNDDVYDRCGKAMGISGEQVRRYVRLNYLISDLLEMVDTDKLPFTTAVALSYLKEPEQNELLSILSCGKIKISLAQAEQLKKLSKEDSLTGNAMQAVLSGTALPGQKKDMGFSKKQMKNIRGCFKPGTSVSEMSEIIIKALSMYFENSK